MKKAISRALQALAIATTLLAPTLSSAADEDEDVPFRELSAQWWQWALSIPASVNPLLDGTGAQCMVGQRGPIWFLAGSLSGNALTRRCSIPQDATLFFPIVNSVQVNTPGVCGQTGPLSVAQMRANNASFIDGITALSVTVDSVAVRDRRRVSSVPFATALPADNIFLPFCGNDQPPGVFSPSVDDGYYVKIDRLKVGTHTLQFTATSPGFNVNVTYLLDVVPVLSR